LGQRRRGPAERPVDEDQHHPVIDKR
jgi:hypothetical protein